MHWNRGIRTTVVVALALVCALGSFGGPAGAALKAWSVAGVTATILPGIADTSSTYNTKDCLNLELQVFADCDTSTLTVQVTDDNATNWATLWSTTINGTSGTYAMQACYAFTRAGTGATTLTEVAPGKKVRLIWNNSDTADTVSTLSIRMVCDQ